ncbi:MAG: VCBS repeat-containing protein, partial [Phycisphaerae bacterium]|nr:VCBS repeat-containing protein [Phycisphaerae bacterium]
VAVGRKVGTGVLVLYPGHEATLPAFELSEVERRVAMGDVNGDGVPDVIVGTGPGTGARIGVFDGATLEGLAIPDLEPVLGGFTGGVFVAAGDLDGDGRAEIVVGTDAGMPGRVVVFDGMTGTPRRSFQPYDRGFTGGVRVAVGDVNGDGISDIVTGAGVGGGPHVKVFNGQTDGPALQEFFAFSATFQGGVHVAAGDLDGDGRAEIITGPGEGGDPVVRVFDTRNPANPRLLRVGPPERTEGVRVGTVFEPGGPDGPGTRLLAAAPMVHLGLLLPAVQKIPLEGPAQTLWLGDSSAPDDVVFVAGRPAPARPRCAVDVNGDGLIDPDDLSDYIGCYFSQPPCEKADFTGDGATNPDDLSDFIAAYFAGDCG